MADLEKPERITGRQFLSCEGVDDWRPIFGGGWACAYFGTGSFETGVALVERIGALAAAADHHPDVDLRAEGVTVRLFSGTWEQLSQRDVELARQISGAARDLGAEADPGRVQHVQVAIDGTAPSAFQVAAGGPPQTFTLPFLLGFTVQIALAGWATLAVLERYTRHAVGIWTALGVTVLALSFAPIALAGASAPTKAALSVIHLSVAGVLLVTMRRSAARA